uniref:Uncharacterized protein n=1 Tax=Cyclophora tenuis TaxID=216820 RepID=A0A7S1DAK3_CYCTE|mmetsp:Transcript_5333/g.9251  ORF Transcript_5333/g.9251 Transcript_5333/m.9251 type:complete len:138 (+) Transcript_5333:113-526(+)
MQQSTPIYCGEMQASNKREEGCLYVCVFLFVLSNILPLLFSLSLSVLLLCGTVDSELVKALESATIVYLYTYPTLLHKLLPLLHRLTHQHQVHSVVTLTYHIPTTTTNNNNANNGKGASRSPQHHNKVHDYCVYTTI